MRSAIATEIQEMGRTPRAAPTTRTEDVRQNNGGQTVARAAADTSWAAHRRLTGTPVSHEYHRQPGVSMGVDRPPANPGDSGGRLGVRHTGSANRAATSGRSYGWRRGTKAITLIGPRHVHQSDRAWLGRAKMMIDGLRVMVSLRGQCSPLK